jgi:hypothetical protein
MILTSTGNQLDIVTEIENNREVVKGLKPRDSEVVIPLSDPEDFVEVLRRELPL